MTCGITVAPMMPTASRSASLFANCGVTACRAAIPNGGCA